MAGTFDCVNQALYLYDNYSHCQSQLLKSVDNYAVLNLDIAWCFLCLRSVTHIPDAEKRLKICEQNFHQSYGPNLERLMALKGTTGKKGVTFNSYISFMNIQPLK